MRGVDLAPPPAHPRRQQKEVGAITVQDFARDWEYWSKA
jgi:hypothetical protein